MELAQMLSAVSNDNIEFVTARSEEATLPIAQRKVVVTAPPELVELSKAGDVNVLEKLIELLPHRDRAWAAEVLLAALTGNEADIVNAFATQPNRWQESIGKNAHERWNRWLKARKGNLVWDAQAGAFVEREQ